MSSPSRSVVLLSLGLLSASALVVVLGIRQIDLNRAYAELRRQATQPHQGYGVPAFLAKTLTGDTVTIGGSTDSAARQVLFVLTTTSPYCKATLPIWARLADSLQRVGWGHVRVVGLSLDSVERTRRYANEHALRFAVTTFPTEKLRRLYRAGSVPQTVVLDANGEVLFAHVGRLEAGPVLDSIYLAVRPRPTGLPGVAGGSPATGTTKAIAKP